MCDVELDNFKLKAQHAKVLDIQKIKIVDLNNQIENLDNEKQKHRDDIEFETRDLQQALSDKFDEKKQVN